MPRYLPVPLVAASEKVKTIYAEVEGTAGFVPNFIGTWAHSENFVGAVADLYKTVTGETSLSEKIRQLVILKTCKLDKCPYTIAHYTPKALDSGWSQEHIDAMETYAESEMFVYYEKETLELAELITSRPDDISDEFWTQLNNHYTSDQVVELITLIGFFNLVNRLVLALQVELEPQLKETPAAVG